jgi:hypothetical protein
MGIERERIQTEERKRRKINGWWGKRSGDAVAMMVKVME